MHIFQCIAFFLKNEKREGISWWLIFKGAKLTMSTSAYAGSWEQLCHKLWNSLPRPILNYHFLVSIGALGLNGRGTFYFTVHRMKKFCLKQGLPITSNFSGLGKKITYRNGMLGLFWNENLILNKDWVLLTKSLKKLSKSCIYLVTKVSFGDSSYEVPNFLYYTIQIQAC